MTDRVTAGRLAECVRLSNGTVEVVCAATMGPRVLRYAFPGGENVLGEWPDEQVPTPFGTFHLMGGHRLWAAPELAAITYAPDNDPVEVRAEGPLAVQLVQRTDAAGLAKEIAVALDPAGPGVTVRHRITNRRPGPVTLAPWALSIMRGGGTVFVPNEPFKSHEEEFLPARPMVLWPYTNLGDGRFAFGPTFTRFTSVERIADPTKIGFGNRPGWAAYASGGEVFVKSFPWREGAAYPDLGCNCEFYTAARFLEMESLGPLVTLAPGESAEHAERWGLFRGLDPSGDDAALDRALAPVREFLRS